MPTRDKIFWLVMILAAAVLLVWEATSMTPQERARKMIQQGMVALKQHHTEEAARKFDAAARLSRNEWTDFAIAQAYLGAGQSREAIRFAERAARRRNTSDSYTLLGDFYRSISDEQGLRRAYLHAIELDPHNAMALNNLGYYYANRGIRLQEAYDLTLRASKLRPSDGTILDSLGWVYYRQERYVDASATLRRAAELAPNSSDIRYHLAMAYLKSGDSASARIELQKALALQPDNQDAREALSMIKGR